MNLYAVGFYFCADMSRVALIRKVKPEWQRGKLNGVGGKVEQGEGFAQAMVREFEEETGVKTRIEDWNCAVEQVGHDYVLTVFHYVSESNACPDFIRAEEQVEWYNTRDLPCRDDMIPNLAWFIFLAFDKQVLKPIKVFT